MTGPGWSAFIIGWIVADLIAKLLLDVVERIYKDEINAMVKKLPLKIKDMSTDVAMTGRNRFLIVILEILRIFAMLFFLPLFLMLTVLPFLRRLQYFKIQFQFFRTLFSRDWMVSALVILEVFSLKGLLLSILCVFQLSYPRETDTM